MKKLIKTIFMKTSTSKEFTFELNEEKSQICQKLSYLIAPVNDLWLPLIPNDLSDEWCWWCWLSIFCQPIALHRLAVKLRLRNAGFRYLGLGFVTYIFIFLTAFLWIFDTKFMPQETFSRISTNFAYQNSRKSKSFEGLVEFSHLTEPDEW